MGTDETFAITLDQVVEEILSFSAVFGEILSLSVF